VFFRRTAGRCRRVLPFTAADVYNGTLRVIARIAVWTTTFTQRGSLPVYVGTIFVVFVAAQGTALGGLARRRLADVRRRLADAHAARRRADHDPRGVFAVRARSATPASCSSR
jgi:hypothetical protein